MYLVYLLLKIDYKFKWDWLIKILNFKKIVIFKMMIKWLYINVYIIIKKILINDCNILLVVFLNRNIKF